MTRKRLPCLEECSGDVEHVLAGENGVGRPVWVCSRCGNRRAGFFSSVDVVDQGVATDGGTDQ